MLRFYGYEKVNLPLPRHFDFGSYYDSVLFEYFNFEDFKQSFTQFKQVLEGALFSVEETFGYRKDVIFKCPIITEKIKFHSTVCYLILLLTL